MKNTKSKFRNPNTVRQAALATPFRFVATFAGALVFSAVSAAGANSFATTDSLANGRQSHTATLLHNGKILVAGGHVSFNPVGMAELYDPATGVWNNSDALDTPRHSHTATLLPNGKVLVVGGYNSSGNSLASAELYDASTGAWIPTGSLATNRAFHTATLLADGKVLVAGGQNAGIPIAGAELYDPATGVWSVRGSLTGARQAHTATLLPNGKVLAAGGTDGFGTFFTSAELYDPATGNWTSTGDLTGGRAYHTACLLPNGKVLAAGGQTAGFNGLASAQLYDPDSGEWTITGGLSTDRYGHTATLLPNGNLLVVGGQTTGGGLLASAQFYNSNTGLWSPVAINLATARAFHSATLLASGQVLVAGGAGAGAGASAEVYNSADGAWLATGNLSSTRFLHTATVLANGRVLVVGGRMNTGSGALASSETYHPATGWSVITNNLLTARVNHTATLLANGTVLVAGGFNTGQLASAELYDPGAERWSVAAPLFNGRYHHTATLLLNGKVLVTGGLTNVSGGTVSSAATSELYDPATGAWTPTGGLTTGRHRHTATLLSDGKVLVVGGLSSNVTSLATILGSAELYDPAAGNWIGTGNLVSNRYLHTATLLANGKVLVASGAGTGSAELYDPATGNWTLTGTPVIASRWRHSATLLPDGKVIVAGGFGNGWLDSAETYDPITGLWTLTGFLSVGREEHTATLLPNGKMLVAGGIYFDLDDFDEHPLSSAELYDPGLGSSGARSPKITSASFDPARRLVLTGPGFRGFSSASGGNGAQDSATSYPLVHWQRLGNEQSGFLLPDPNFSVSDTRFTSVAVPGLPPGYTLMRVLANGIPSTASVVLIGFPSIAVELPGGTVVPDGGTHAFMSVLGTPASSIFTIRNRGSVILSGLTVVLDGTNAADFTLTSSPATLVPPGGYTTFSVQFASSTPGTKTVTLHISNNVAGFDPYDVTLTGTPVALSFTEDSDDDGMSDASEVQLAVQGFDWQVPQPALVSAYYANASNAGLYTTSQVQALNAGTRLLQKNPTNGLFTLTIGVQKSTNLVDFVPFPMTAGQTTFNEQGALRFQFAAPDNAAFFRLEAH
jgi:N-acetylneuraminic acid mutarotase